MNGADKKGPPGQKDFEVRVRSRRGWRRMGNANLLVTNAKIYTARPTDPWAEAIACTDGRIVAIGATRDTERSAGPKTKRLDAHGRLVLPGFIDAHTHLIWGFELGTWIDLTDWPSLGEVQERVARYAREHPDDAILIGHGFDYEALQAGSMPGKEALDATVSDRPVLLTSWDGHTGWANSRFIRIAQRIAAERGRDVGEMQLDPATSEPTGVFTRTFDLTPLVPEVQARRSLDGLRRTVSEASRCGITTAFDVQVNREDVHAYADLRARGELTVRMRIALYHPEATDPSAYAGFEASKAGFQDDWIQVGAVKLYIDGVAETGTAALLDPYTRNPSARGPALYTFERFREIVAEFDRRGFQICTHACGDRGARLALDAYEAAARANETSGRRHRIEHCELLAPSDLPRFAQLDVIPCMMPRHSAPELTARWRDAVGPDRADAGFPWRELRDAGASLAFASDWPVAPMDPLLGIREATGRLSLRGGPSGHRITMQEAVDAYTRQAAYACHAESTRGTLVVGKYADFIVLSDDIFTIRENRLASARVIGTYVAGRSVYSEAG